MGINRVDFGGRTLIDISNTTATAEDVAVGKYFYTAGGTYTEGTKGGRTTTIVVPETTLTVSGSYTPVPNFTELLIEGEEYIATINGVEYKRTASSMYGSILAMIDSNIAFENGGNTLYFDVLSSSLYGSYTIKLEKILSDGGGSEPTLIAKTITENGTYLASSDNADGFSSVTVNVPASSSKSVQIAAGMNRVATTSYSEVSGQSLTVAKSGTYDIYWTGFRSSTGGTNGSRLYINGTAYDSAQTTFSNHGQSVHLSNVNLTNGQVLSLRARSRGSIYYMYAGNLTIIEQE